MESNHHGCFHPQGPQPRWESLSRWHLVLSVDLSFSGPTPGMQETVRGTVRRANQGDDPALAILRNTQQYGECTMASKQSKQGKQSVSFRFDPITVRRLKDHAADAGSGQTALAERYIEEGIRQDEHPLIYFREGAAGRRPALLGSRLDVPEAIETIRQNEGSVEEAASYLEIPVEQLEAAARYYGEYTDEVDELVERSRVASERERERWRRGHEALA